MRDRPSKADLLRAVASFLDSEIRGALAADPRAIPRDPSALAFRVLIASHLTSLVAAETEAERGLDARELTGLLRLLPAVPVSEGQDAASDPRQVHRALNAALAERIRARALSAEERAEVMAHVMSTLRDELRVTNPKFSQRMDIP